MATITVGINGMGVLGRQLLRYLATSSELDITVGLVNDPYMTFDNFIYLLKHDSIYGDFAVGPVDETAQTFTINGHIIHFVNKADVSVVPWSDQKVGYVIDCTGMNTKEQAQDFIDGGAKYVILTSPRQSDTSLHTFVPDVNTAVFTVDNTIITMSNIETQVASTILKLVDSNVGIQWAYLHSFTAYTNAQNTIDSFNDDYALGRAGAWNISPVGSSFKDVGIVLPALNGKTPGTSTRAPVIDGGMIVFDIWLSNPSTLSEIRELLKVNGTPLAYTEDSIVSSDVRESNYYTVLGKAIILDDTGTHVSISVMYDNIQAYVYSIVKMLQIMEQAKNTFNN